MRLKQSRLIDLEIVSSAYGLLTMTDSVTMVQYAFYFDSSACSGCKACQAACKDKNALPVGLLWRRVYEVTGGGWSRVGEARVSDVFAYNLSLSCQHCQRPICVEVCPTRAMHKRADGIVLVDQDKCLGCQYCSWACPYDAPQYDAAHGLMTKCNFCVDELEAGRSPVCVAACPLRVLDYGDLDELAAKHSQPIGLPLPEEHLTQPALLGKSHAAAGRAARLSNAEEVELRETSQEASLIVFTLLAQLAVGGFWFLALLRGLNVTALWCVTAFMLAALAASFFHLGSPRNAWRAIGGWRTSWLSREVFFAALFAAALSGELLLTTVWRVPEISAWFVSLIGLALLLCMGQAYRLRTVPQWHSWTTPLSFFLTALLLGSLFAGAWLRDLLGPGWVAVLIGLLIAQNGIAWQTQRGMPQSQWLIARWGLALMAVIVLLGLPGAIGWWGAFALALGSEAVGRIRFYAARFRRAVWRLTP